MSKKTLVFMFVFGLAFAQGTMAGVKGFMEDMFLYTSTNPQIVQTQARNVAIGGHLSLRTPIRAVNILTISPPRLEVGACGGIDFFAGAFSMINKDEAIAILRAIGSQALMYAFKLALETISGLIANVIGDLFDQIQAWTRQFRNTCQITNEILDSTFRSGSNVKTWGRNLAETFQLARSDGCEDAADCAQQRQDDPDSLVEGVADEEAADRIWGNFTWMALNNPNLQIEWGRMFDFTETEAKEVMMSLTGTVLNCGGSDDPAYRPPLFRITDFFAGEATSFNEDDEMESVSIDFNVYTCSASVNNDCCSIDKTTKQFGGFREAVREQVETIDAALMNNPSTIVGDGSIANFLSSTSIPVVAYLNRFRFQPEARVVLREVMIDLIAKEYLIRFSDEVVRLSRMLHNDNPIGEHALLYSDRLQIIEDSRMITGNYASQLLDDLMRLHEFVQTIERFYMQATIRQRLITTEN